MGEGVKKLEFTPLTPALSRKGRGSFRMEANLFFHLSGISS